MNKIADLLSYASRGLPIFPLHDLSNGSCSCGRENCASPGKHPRTRNGFKDATLDANQIEAWHNLWPNANWGLATGSKADGGGNIVVIDADAKTGGLETWQLLRDSDPEFPETVVVVTGGEDRGEHWYFRYPNNGCIKSSAGKLGPGVDVRGAGGYVIIPPSRTTHLYEFKRSLDDVEISPLPDWLSLRLNGQESIEEEHVRTEMRDGALVPQGQRHQKLVGLSGSLRRSGLELDEIETSLLAFAEKRFSPGDHKVTAKEISDVAKWVSQKPRQFNLTDLGNAERLIAQHGQDLKYCKKWKSWLVWDGRCWKSDDVAEVERRAYQTVRSIYTEAGNAIDKDERIAIAKWAKSSEHRSRIDSMIHLARAMVPVVPDELDTHPMLLNVRNGVLDLRTATLLPHHRDLMLTKVIEIDFNLKAEYPKWMKFLELITGNDRELELFIQLSLGYSLTGNVDEHSFFILLGSGQNGKTTFIRAIQNIMGDFAGLIDTESLLRSWGRGEGPTPQVAGLAGKRFVVGNEIPENRKLNESLIKHLTGGDTINARYLHQNPFSFEPSHKLFLFGNFLPTIVGTDLGIWRRVKIIPFNVTIPSDIQRPMSEVLDDFANEGEGILLWMVEGCLLWQANGLTQSKAVVAATAEYRTEQDALRQFIDECCEMHPDFTIAKDELFKSMRSWADDNNEMDLNRRSKKWFTNQLKMRGIVRDRGKRNYVGIRLS